MPTTITKNEDLLALHSYVVAADARQYESLAEDTILIDLTHSNLVQRHIEQRFDKHTSLEKLRERIYLKTGTPPGDQRLVIKDGFGTIVADIAPFQQDDRMLGYFGMDNGWNVHCIDINPLSGSAKGGYEDVSRVEKYRMSEQEYDKRQGTLRDWTRQKKTQDSNFSLAKHAREHREWAEARRQAKLGLELPKGFAYDESGNVMRIEHDKEEQKLQQQQQLTESTSEVDEKYGPQSIEGMELGMRCEAQPGGRRGRVEFIGQISDLGRGFWVGVKFDEPVGKADGYVNGKRYFEAQPGFGGFLRGGKVIVGDFPERDIFDEDDDSQDEI